MSLKAKVEAIIYATEEPVTLDQLASLLKDATLAEFRAEEDARFARSETIYDGRSAAADLADFPESDSAQPDAEATDASASSEPAQRPTADSASEEQYKDRQKWELREVKSRLSSIIEQLTTEYSAADRGMEIRQVAGGYRMATKPEHHDVVVTFAKSLKPPIRLSLQALETLSVIAYKQPVTVPEISEIRGVDSSGVIATLLDRKLITTAGRKQVIGRPILYKTTKEFLMRFGLNDVSELPSIEEFEKLGEPQAELFPATSAQAEAPSPAPEATAEPATAKEEEE